MPIRNCGLSKRIDPNEEVNCFEAVVILPASESSDRSFSVASICQVKKKFAMTPAVFL
jgi:hypothetical protein